MIKRILLTCLLLSSINALAAPVISAIPCHTSAGLITDTVGFSGNENLCDFQAEQLKLKVYKVAMCTQAPSFDTAIQPNFSSCSFIYNNDTYSEITVSASTGFNLSGLTKPAAGTYKYILLVTSNDVKIKAQAHFDTDRTSSLGGGSGRYCWTNGSVIDYKNGSVSSNEIDPTINFTGLSCGSAVDSSYGFNEIDWAGAWGRPENAEPVPGGSSVRSFLTANLLLTTNLPDIIKTAYVNTLETPITITENTSALKMSINITTGATLVFNGSEIINWIEDAPFAYIIEPVNESIF
jgi:hypothetical protein